LREAKTTLAGLADVPSLHKPHVERTRKALAEIERQAATLTPHYEILRESPPVATTASDETSGSEARDARRTIAQLESKLYSKVHELAWRQQRLVENTALGVAKNERKVRIYAIYLGAIAVAVALLIAFWVTITLRPLKRLQQAAQRIARGDYASRIEEKGPREVADLAHEFNLMGRAIQVREREMVRNERLAAVGKMAAMITHEVRNPLSSIALNSELLEEELGKLDGESKEEVGELVRSIHLEIDRLTEMTEEYLKFARLPKPKLRAEDVNEVIESLVAFERGGLSQRGIEIDTMLEQDLPLVELDESLFRQALRNLVRNAAEALDEHRGAGHISITTRREGEDTIEVEVADDGPGIPQELADKLFDPFVSTKERGTGLGLALTHQIASEHGGLLSVESAPGEGTRFRMRLPTMGSKRPSEPRSGRRSS